MVPLDVSYMHQLPPIRERGLYALQYSRSTSEFLKCCHCKTNNVVRAYNKVDRRMVCTFKAARAEI